MLPGDLLANNARGWRGRKKKYDLCRLRLWDSCRCILSVALREYNRKRNHCSLRKHRGAGLGTLLLLAASTGLALAAVQPLDGHRLPELRGLPASGTGPRWGPTAHPDTPFQGWHLRVLVLTAARGIQDRQRDAQSYSQPAKASSRPSASPKNILGPSPCLPSGSTPLLPLSFPSPREHVLSCVSLSPALNLVLGLAIKSPLMDTQMVCVSGKSQGAREMSPEHGASPLLRVPPSPPPTPAMLYLLSHPSRPRSLVHTKSRPCTGSALM